VQLFHYEVGCQELRVGSDEGLMQFVGCSEALIAPDSQSKQS
jgi:hypothetical protein